MEEVEKRNKLKMLNPFLEQLVSEGSKVGTLGRTVGWEALPVAGLDWASSSPPLYDDFVSRCLCLARRTPRCTMHWARSSSTPTTTRSTS